MVTKANNCLKNTGRKLAMIDRLKIKFLDKAGKWLKAKNISDIFLLVIILTSAVIFANGHVLEARAASNELMVADKNIQKAYFTYYNGHNIGIIKDKNDIKDILNEIQKEFEKKFNMETKLEFDGSL